MKQFKYDVVELIKCVRDRPVIWDKTLEIYKDRLERKYAWDEIFRNLDEGFDEMTREKQRTTGEMVITKWTNMRDTFLKSLKNQNANNRTRKYLYHDQMSFLQKVIPVDINPDRESAEAMDSHLNESDDDPISYDMTDMKQEMETENEGTGASFTEVKRQSKKSRSSKYSEASSSDRDAYLSNPRKKRSKKEPDERRSRKKVDESPPVDFIEVNEVNDPRVMNEDEAFFASLLPTVVKYSEDERLEFRVEVLAVMKSINDKRRQRWTNETVD